LTLDATGDRNEFAIDLEQSKVLDRAARGPTMVALLDWLSDNGADVWIRPDRGTPTDARMMAVDTLLIPASPTELEKGTPDSLVLQMMMSSMLTEQPSLTKPATGVYQFRTRNGAMGLLQVKSGDASGKVDLRIRLLQKEAHQKAASALATRLVLPDLQNILAAPAPAGPEQTISRAGKILRRLNVLLALLQGTDAGNSVQETALLARRYEQAAIARNDAQTAALSTDLDSHIVAMIETIRKDLP